MSASAFNDFFLLCGAFSVATIFFLYHTSDYIKLFV